MSKVVKEYIKSVKVLFPIHGKLEKQYLKELEMHIMEFSGEKDTLCYDDIAAEFGAPSSVISDYFSEINESYLFHHLKIKKYIRSCLTFILASVILFNGYCYYLAYCDYQQAQKEHIAYEETVIIEGE